MGASYEKIKELEKWKAMLTEKCNCDFVGYSAENIRSNFSQVSFQLSDCEKTLLGNGNEWIFEELKNTYPSICEIDILKLVFINKGERNSVTYFLCEKASK